MFFVKYSKLLYFFPDGQGWPDLSISLGDIDEDGDLDMAALSFCPECCVSTNLFLNVGTGLQPIWEEYQSQPSSWWEAIDCVEQGDLLMLDHEGDGDQDIGLLTAPMGQLYVFENRTSSDSLVIAGPRLVAGADPY